MDSIFELIVPLALALFYAFTTWVNKQKKANAKSNFNTNTRTSLPPKIEDTPSTSGGWLERLETMVEEAQLNQNDDAGEHLDNLPPILDDQNEIANIEAISNEQAPVFSDEPIDKQINNVRDLSPVYKSPIYNSNIAKEIANNINVARQGIVSAIILNPPRALEDPDKITRY